MPSLSVAGPFRSGAAGVESGLRRPRNWACRVSAAPTPGAPSFAQSLRPVVITVDLSRHWDSDQSKDNFNVPSSLLLKS